MYADDVISKIAKEILGLAGSEEQSEAERRFEAVKAGAKCNHIEAAEILDASLCGPEDGELVTLLEITQEQDLVSLADMQQVNAEVKKG